MSVSPITKKTQTKYVLVKWITKDKNSSFTVLEASNVYLKDKEKYPSVGLQYKINYNNKNYEGEVLKLGKKMIKIKLFSYLSKYLLI